MQHSDWDDDFSILSAENVNFAVETAGIGSRFAAMLVDVVIQILVLLLGFWFVSIFIQNDPSPESWLKWFYSFAGAMMVVFVFLLLYGYYFFFEWLMRGQTPGKYLVGLRVLQTNGQPVTAWPALVRNVLRIVDFLPLLYAAGSLVALLNPLNRRIGDLVAGTVVAREQKGNNRRFVLDISAAADAFMAEAATKNGITASAATAPAHPAPAAFPSLLDLEGEAPPLTSRPAARASNANTADGADETDALATAWMLKVDDQDYELLLEFLTRRITLLGPARTRLGRSLAYRLAAKLGEVMPPPHETESFLENIAAVLKKGR